MKTQTTLDTLNKARRYARSMFNTYRKGEYRHAHNSHAAARALEDTAAKFNLGCGVEGDCAENGEGHFTVQYINMGDTYDATVCYYQGHFIVSSWGDLAERNI